MAGEVTCYQLDKRGLREAQVAATDVRPRAGVGVIVRWPVTCEAVAFGSRRGASYDPTACWAALAGQESNVVVLGLS